MRDAVTRVGSLLACVAFFALAPASRGQGVDFAGFFDSDEAGARQAQVLEALNLVCPEGAILRDQHGNASGCRDCPKQTSFNDEKGLSWDVKRVFTGHFTSPTGENLILSGRGCGSHSSNFGGSFVFALEGAGVKLMRYDEALITERCRKFVVRDGPDMLVCTDDWGAQVTLWSYVYQVAFDGDGDSDVHRIFETIDLSRQHCGIDFFTDKPTFIQESHLIGLKMEKSPTGLLVLVLTANFGKRFPTAEERKVCEQGTPIPLTLRTYRMEFLFDGSTFQPSEATKDALKAFPEPETPENSYAPKH